MDMNKPKIALIGYGSMGKEVERAAIDHGLRVTDIFELDHSLSEDKNYDFDVAIDFSFPDSVINNVRTLAKLHKNIVIGTTGWNNQFEEIKDIVLSSGIGAVYGSNFSIGMQMFSRIVQEASKIVNRIDDYDIFMQEIHHKRKKDSPSGTALSLANLVLKEVERKKEILTAQSDGTINPAHLHVSSTRGGEVPGTHTIYLDSVFDTIELTHRAKNRKGFAIGSVEAANWIYGKTGLYSFDDIIKELWS